MALFALAMTVATVSKIVIWPLFVCGQLLSILRKAELAVQATTNPIKSRREYARLYWVILLYRSVVALSIFWVWVIYPAAFSSLAHSIGLTWNLELPPTPPIAIFAGLLYDVGLEWVFNKVPSLRIDLPPVPSANAAGGAR